MTQWTHNFDSHPGQSGRRLRCPSIALPGFRALGMSKDGSVNAPKGPPG